MTRSVRRSIASGAVFEVEMVDEWQLSSDGKTLTLTSRTQPSNRADNNGSVTVLTANSLKTVYKLISQVRSGGQR